MKGLDLRVVTRGGLALALAVVLSFIKIWQMPQGGSVTLLSMLPVIYFAYTEGLLPGLLVGVLYGLLQYLIEPYFVHPVQFLLDYPVAFGALGLAGLFAKKSPYPGVVLAILGRFLSHLISGVVFFASYAPKGQSPWVYSAIYNGSYLLPELILTLGAVYLLKIFERLRKVT
ncbi:energy-coupled thiamine transporter ThiT [Carboxydothermus hydrogenoformans]|uniref:Probable proton-coupled thiamine transporter YuaJ n=1 Tax=Carboxydothermus hydrogenoformans (strain ATCC BAA-161 / DSM 6008 / Z-2901) TaxID=246194 RepID=Q3AFI2_CARHZ|nr:energy-coupled thiamine transporter ThiT [Carboxydothermus hydrogenoformans]ABB14998.1 probable proton-coupled thiamine transporter YuaJ [Carboxydothermus hydrogenoformans Z-2901]